MPDRSTRYLVSKMSELEVDCFCLIDGDPCGFDIFLTYKIGSWQMVHETNLVASRLKLAGVKPSQFEKLHFEKEATLPMIQSDFSRLESMRLKLIARLKMKGDGAESGYESQSSQGENFELSLLLRELDIFETLKYKVEIESLESINNGILRGSYLTNFYLRTEIEHAMEEKHNYSTNFNHNVFKEYST